MKYILGTLLIATLLMFSPGRTHAQTASVTEGCAPLLVEFTPPSGLGSFFWDFKNGNNSILSNPTETFQTPGTYEVSFGLGVGQPVLGTVTITVYAKPDLSFAADPAGGCAPLPVQFSNDSEIDAGIRSAGVSWNWNFGDGQTAQSETANHQYAAAGSYNVSLQLISSVANCSVVETETGFVNVSSVEPAFATVPDPASSCSAPLTVSFNNLTQGDGLTFDWDFGNGEASDAISPPSVTYLQEGQYDVLLTVTDANGCAGSITKVVSVGTPAADFSVPDTLCLGQPFTLGNNSTAGTYRWTFGTGATPVTSGQAAPEVTFNTPGNHDIRLVVTSLNGQCTGEIIKTVFVQEVDPSFTTDPSFLCSDPFEFTYTPATLTNATYMWLFSDSTTSTTATPTYSVPVDTNQYAESGVREIETMLTLTTSAGCTATFSRTDTVFKAYALFMPDINNGCAPLAVTFSDSSHAYSNIVSYTYIYDDGNTQTFTNDNDHTYVFTQAGEYDVRLVIEDASGCRDTSYAVRIEVGSAITPDFVADKQEVCPGEEVTLTTITDDPRIDSWHFATDDGRSSHCYNEPNLTWSFISEANTTNVTLTVEYNGCYKDLTKLNFIEIKGPIANLYYEMDCEAPLEYTFRDSSFAATTTTWDFGDGTTGTGAEVVHTYAETGDYMVKLIAENPATGCPASIDSALVCVRQPEAKFELEPMICIGTEVDLDGSQSVDVNADCWKGYTWFFDISGRPITTQDSVISWNFSNPGLETVMLEVEDVNGCKDTATVMTQIYDIQADFALSDDRICVPANVLFTDQSNADTMIVKWTWEFGDGAGMSSQQNPSYTYNNLFGVPPGEGISVSLSIEDRLGCTAETTKTISVYQPVSNITATDTQICSGETVNFSATDFTAEGSNLTFSWNFGNGQSATGRTAGPITYTGGGSYPVVLSFVENGTGCAGQTNTRIEVQDFPVPNVSIDAPDPENICVNTPVQFLYDNPGNQVLTYSWQFSDGQRSTAEDPQLTFSQRGEVTYTLDVSTTFGCAASTSGGFTVVGPAGDFTFAPTAFCVGDEVTFNLVDTSGVSSWDWTFGDGGTAQNQSPVVHVFDNVPTTGNRTVSLILRDENGCEFSPPAQTLFIGGAPVEVLESFACAGDTIILSAGELRPGSSYSWSPANVLINPNSANPRAVITSTTTFTVTVTSSLGCISEDSGTITVAPQIIFSGQNIVACSNDPITLPEPDNPDNIFTFTWIPEGPVVTPDPNQEVTTVTLRVNDPAGCQENNVFEFNISSAENSFKIPNVFTPNGDEVNNEFKVYAAEGNNLNITTFKIYNRWGKVVFDGSGASNPSWNGEVNGKPAPSEVYTYFIEMEVPQCDTPIQKRGDVTLLR